MSLFNPSTKTILIGLAVLGTYGTWVRSLLNGTLAILFRALHITGRLPGTDVPIKTSFTGIYWPVDYLLDVLVLFFWQAVDGSHPQTSLFGLYFASQFIAVIATLYLDSYRTGKSQQWFHSIALWLLVFQLTGVAASGPFFVLLDLIPKAAESFHLPRNRVEAIRVLPLSILGGYVALVILMALPSTGPRAILTPAAHQVAIVAWNVYPIFVAPLQHLLEKVVGGSEAKNRPTDAIVAIRRVYAFALFFSAISHAALVGVTGSTVLFPMLFDHKAVNLLHPGRILRIPLSHATVRTLGAGALQFMQWDVLVGFLTVLVPAIVGYRKVVTAGSGGMVNAVAAALAATVALGPGGAVVLVKWIQDEVSYSRQAAKQNGHVEKRK